MKIQCDACASAEATLFCCADEAALCKNCDSKVHDANKLASKHQRLSLSDPSADSLRCDICQEKRGFFFCQADRAIFCRDCDVSIHSANELTANHTRFLVSGTTVRPRSDGEGSSPQSSRKPTTATLENSTKSGKESRKSATPASSTVPSAPTATAGALPRQNRCEKVSSVNAVAGNEMSQYLSEVEELLASNVDWCSMTPYYQTEDTGKGWTEEWTSSVGYPMPDSLAEVPRAPLTPSGGLPLNYEKLGGFLGTKTKAKQQSLQEACRSFASLYNSWVDDNFTVPDITGLAEPATKRMRVAQQQHYLPDRFL